MVLACVQGEQCWILHTDLHGEWSRFSLGSVAPRFDLPRAWTPDGEPELAQALAEETWEYSYQELRGDEWETAFNDVTHLEEWWPKKSDVDWIVEEARKHGYVCRLVRRHVSTVEVINE